MKTTHFYLFTHLKYHYEDFKGKNTPEQAFHKHVYQ